MFAITAPYAGGLALLLLGLSINVIRHRMRMGASHGDHGDDALAKAIRVQGNCAEYAPLGLILLALTEAQGAPGWSVHVLGLMLVLGRVMHAYGFGRTPQVIPLRQAGMIP